MRFERLILHQVGPFEDLDLTFREGKDPELADVHVFVGPNGTGKSTLLYALAQLTTPETTPLAHRIWGRDSSAWAKGERWVGLGRLGDGKRDPDGGKVQFTGPLIQRLGFLTPDGTAPVVRRDRHLPRPIFTYSGYRRVHDVPLDAIREPTTDPLAGAATFEGASDTSVLKQWIANQKARAALAQARGDADTAAARVRTVALLERTLSDITELDLTFELREEPLEVVVRANGEPLDLAVLPDGMKSVLSWLGDLLMRLDRLPADPPVPVEQRPFVLLLDEIEVHLHPKWQRKILPAVQRMFPNAQVFLATHSPFVVASASDAWIYPLDLENGRAVAREPLPSRIGHSYVDVLQEVFGLTSEFDVESEKLLSDFLALRDRKLRGEDVDAALTSAAGTLADRSVELGDIVGRELRMLRRVAGSTA